MTNKVKKPLTQIERAENSIVFFKRKLHNANSSTPNKHIHKWQSKLDRARSTLSRLTNGASK